MKAILFVSIFSFIPVLLFGHGEDRLGPHGGYVRMPGGFHTEVKIQNSELLVYLLDIDWMNPTVKNSSVRAEYRIGEKILELECKALALNFSCFLPKNLSLKQGTIVVKAEREGMKAVPAEYPLPFARSKPDK